MVIVLLAAATPSESLSSESGNSSGTQTAETFRLPQTVRLDRFEEQIRAFEKKDAQQPPPPGGTVFIGSSTFALWTDLEYTFRAFQAVNRGFGGSTLPEVIHYTPRVVLKYQPKRVVVYAGTNDIADGRTGQQVYTDFCRFVDIVHAALPDCRIYFVSASVAPSRQRFALQYDQANSLIHKRSLATGSFIFIDVTAVMRDAQGNLKTGYFGPDNLHMNTNGYAAWIPVIARALEN